MLRFAVRAVLIAILHFAITLAFVFAWSGASEAENQRTWTSFGYSAGTMAFSSPLYQVPAARQRLPFLVGAAINSALWGIFLAIVFSRVRRLWLLLLIPILWYATLTSVAALLERRVPITTRFPHQNANESSRRVDQLLKAIDDEDFSRMRGGLQKYLSAEFARGDDRIEPLPVDAGHFIVQHRFDLDSLEIALLSSEPPRWEIDLTTSEKPDWLRYFWLQKLIVADAVDSAHSMDAAGARRRLEAAQRLTFSLSSRPEASAVMAALASAENQLGAARKLGTTLPRFDPRDRLVEALEAESRSDRFLVATSRFDRDWNNRSSISRALLAIFVRPYARLCAAMSAADQLRNVRIVRDMQRCVFQPPKYPEEHRPPILNPIAAATASATTVRAVRSNRLLLDFEGTEKIAQAKSEGAIRPASFCSDHKWMRDGDVVHLEPPEPAANSALPTRHTISPAARMQSSEISPAPSPK
jgi:hypothetical protein